MTKPRILILRGGAIGDFIFTLPALRALRAQWQESYIEITGYPHIAQLALAGGMADLVSSLDKAEIARYFSLKPSIPREQADYIKSFDIIISYLFDPAGSVTKNLLSIGAKQVIYGSPVVKAGHAVDSLMKPLEKLAIYPENNETPILNLQESRKEYGRKILEKIGRQVLAIHPGSGSPAKNWPLNRFISLSRKISGSGRFEPIFLIGEADAEIATTLSKNKIAVPILSGYSLVDLAGILSACCGYIGNDSGITHLAASLGIPVVAIYGPTDPAMWAPRGPNTQIIASSNRSEKRLAEISEERVLEALAQSQASNL
ncbi:MAG: hypothetical protein A2283_12535 [Lentisphaerae bacterium RIFOXYA12_FULL_48_11]|nr:MAG: hypothetical protein A2283_12535 [Lentisphaerae bacterium RIFOXYA12_FULL_48_11]